MKKIIAILVFLAIISTSLAGRVSAGACDDGCCYPNYNSSRCVNNNGKCEFQWTSIKWEDCPCGENFSYAVEWCGAGCSLKRTNTTQLCGSGGSTEEPTCKDEGSCTATCPAGTTTNDYSGSPAPSASCSYDNGKVNKNGTCSQDTNTINCWYPADPPDISTQGLNTVSPQGCSVANNVVGQTVNNTVRISASFDDLNASNPNVALMLWFHPNNTVTIDYDVNKVLDTGQNKLGPGKAQWGMLVRKQSGIWDSIYLPNIDTVAGSSWVKSGTVGTGLRANMLDSSGKKSIGIRDISVSSPAGKNVLTFDLEFYNGSDDSKIADNNYHIYGNYIKFSAFLPSLGNSIANFPKWLNTTKSITVDLNSPVVDALNVSVFGENSVKVLWKFSDSFSSIKRSIGDMVRVRTGITNGTVDDTTSGVNNYVLGSGATGANLYAGLPHLWVVNNDSQRTDVIELNSNEGGEINTIVYGFDSACNMASAVKNMPLGNAWITTRSGSVYSNSGSLYEISKLSGHSSFSTEPYWGSPFGFFKDEADITTEIMSLSSAATNSLLYPATVGTVQSINHFDSNNKKNYWYTELLRRNDLEVTQNPGVFSVVNFVSSTTLTTNSSSIVNGSSRCTAGKYCVVKVTGDLTVNNPFVCNLNTLFLVSGNITLQPNIVGLGKDKGCIFVSKGNVTIGSGSYKSGASTYPLYDILEAFIIADGEIRVPIADTTRAVRDGLLIHGSLLAFGNPTDSSITIRRSLKLLHNQNFPSVAIHFDNRYLNMSTVFVGGENDGFKREVGFKPL